jgi:hypothetical protein
MTPEERAAAACRNAAGAARHARDALEREVAAAIREAAGEAAAEEREACARVAWGHTRRFLANPRGAAPCIARDIRARGGPTC